MNLRQIAAWGKTDPAEQDGTAISSTERSLTLLVEGTALNMPEIDVDSYRQQDPAPGGQGDPARVLARHPPGAVQGQHRPRGIGASTGQGRDFRLRHRLAA